MALGGNPEEIRRQARAMRRHADTVLDVSDRVATGHGVQWTGRAADRFRERLAREGQALAQTRETVLGAATELDHLAATLDERQAAIRRAMAAVEDEIERARSTISRFAGEVWDTLTGAEQNLEKAARRILGQASQLPPVGHPDWIQVASKMGRLK